MAGWITEALDAFQLDYLFVKIRKKDGHFVGEISFINHTFWRFTKNHHCEHDALKSWFQKCLLETNLCFAEH